MSHKEWRAFGIVGGFYRDGPDSSQIFYHAFRESDVVLRTLVSVHIVVKVLEQDTFTVTPSPIICQVDVFDGPEGTSPPSLRGTGHSLATFMPTIYPSVETGTGPFDLPVTHRLWVGGTGGRPISSVASRDVSGPLGGPHLSLRSGWAWDVGSLAEFQPSPWSITWDVQVLVLRTP